VYRSSHSFIRKFWIHIELVYQIFNLLFSWFGLANYYIAFNILSQSLEDPSFNLGKGIHIVNVILGYIYLSKIVLQNTIYTSVDICDRSFDLLLYPRTR
jgi:chitin synthase